VFIVVVCYAAINPKQPLPPPKWVATELRQQAVTAINEWHNTFGKAYKRLSIAYNFLKSSSKVNFGAFLCFFVWLKGRNEFKSVFINDCNFIASFLHCEP